MKKLSQSEGIALGSSVVALGIFLPVFFSVTAQPASVEIEGTQSASSTLHTGATIELEQAVVDFEVRDIVEGTGATAEIGDTLFVHYVGSFPSGEQFDSSVDRELPYPVILGNGEVIAGWELGLVGMREGGTRQLIIPPELGYGRETVRDTDGNVVIPANAVLHFDVVLLGVQK